MIREGIRDSSTFAQLHPAVTTVYFVLVIALTMFSNAPLPLAMSLIAASVYRVLLNGTGEIRSILIVTLFAVVLVTVINGLFTHNGATVLFYIGSNRITLEAMAFGAIMSLMLSASIQWFVCFSVITTSDKMIYIFGAVLPVIGLVISIIFRSIPLLKKRYSDIDAAQKAMGRDNIKGPVRRARQFLKQISILVAWSLEASIDTADSMTARGYGLRRRTTFHLFRFETRDVLFLLLTGVFGAAAVWACALKFGRMYYYPQMRPASELFHGPLLYGTAAVMAVLFLIPAMTDLYGEHAWKKYGSAI